VPLYQDIYDEHIPEMSSEREASSFHTKRQFRKSGKVFNEEDDEDIDSKSEGEIVGSIRQTSIRLSENKLRNSMPWDLVHRHDSKLLGY